MSKLLRPLFAMIGAMLGMMEHFKLFIYSKDAEGMQRRLLMRLMKDNKNTVYGKSAGFEKVKSVEDYQNIVPFSTYGTYEDYIKNTSHI